MANILLQEPSVRSLFIEVWSGSHKIGKATGFVVIHNERPILLTNLHVVSGLNIFTNAILDPNGLLPDRLVIAHNQLNKLGNWISRTEPLFDAQGKPLWKTHPMYGVGADVAALPLTQLDDVQVYPYDLANPGVALLAVAGSEISVVGFPYGVSSAGWVAIWTTGHIASEPDLNYQNRPVFLIDCRTNKGQSGSPVIVFRGGGFVAMDDGSGKMIAGPQYRLLGIYSGTIHEDLDIGMVWKLRAIRELVAAL